MAPKVVLVVFLLVPISIALGREQLGVGAGVTRSFKISTLCWEPRAARKFVVKSCDLVTDDVRWGPVWWLWKEEFIWKTSLFWNTFQDLVQWSPQAIGWWIILSFKPLKVIEQLQLLSSKSYSALSTHLSSKDVLECTPWTNDSVLGYRNLDWVPCYFHRGICGRNLFDILRPQRWRCTERQNVITAPPHSRRPLDGGQWMTCWQAENSRNFLDGARKEVLLWYPNLLPCIWWRMFHLIMVTQVT